MPSPCSAESGTGIAEAERERLVGAVHPLAALGLVGDEDHRLTGTAHKFGQRTVGRQDAGARIDHEHHRIGLGDGGFGLRPHAPEERLVIGVLEPAVSMTRNCR
jgi:hypothetical protein